MDKLNLCYFSFSNKSKYNFYIAVGIFKAETVAIMHEDEVVYIYNSTHYKTSDYKFYGKD